MSFNWVLDRTKYLSRQEVRLLRKAASKPSLDAKGSRARTRFREWFLIELGLETGLRVAEMTDLDCGDLILTQHAPAVHVRAGKGDKPRTVDVSDAFVNECYSFLRWKQRNGESTEPDAPLIPGRGGRGKVTKRALQRAFKRVAARAGLPSYYAVHCLRHTYGTLLYEASGCDIRFVQQQLGHSNVSTTEVYAHVARQQARQSLSRLSRIYRTHGNGSKA